MLIFNQLWREEIYETLILNLHNQNIYMCKKLSDKRFGIYRSGSGESQRWNRKLSLILIALFTSFNCVTL